jgi:hypothetical protein
VSSSLPELPQPLAELYSILARDEKEAEELDAKTKPEPQEILDMYEACSKFTVKGLWRYLWLTPSDRSMAPLSPVSVKRP